MVTDAQWNAAREAFDEQLKELGTGYSMPDEKYDLIVSILKECAWDGMSPAERLTHAEELRIATRSFG